ncbi:cytochrome c oxidase subunit NDUFA4-like [Leptopilina boulardi]|uniref:cytochrome c oxidase subunit NDUFA4-like n=1 Tax=Leptopilina boulardi TaxID=63433 RepID=UPI0021F69C10|nr:cytochrome c oxidase subunit NDUFA4-like [Leptopilina boulardi]
MTLMQGLDLKSIKKHPSLIPLYAVLLAGCATSVLYLARLGLKNPDVSWNLKSKPEPWNDYKDRRYKLLNPIGDKETPPRMKSIFDF